MKCIFLFLFLPEKSLEKNSKLSRKLSILNKLWLNKLTKPSTKSIPHSKKSKQEKWSSSRCERFVENFQHTMWILLFAKLDSLFLFFKSWDFNKVLKENLLHHADWLAIQDEKMSSFSSLIFVHHAWWNVIMESKASKECQRFVSSFLELNLKWFYAGFLNGSCFLICF